MENKKSSCISRWTPKFFDKLESSPNNRATCVRCGQKIVKESERVGIQAKFSTPSGQQVWRMRYYHGGCVDDDVKRKLHLDNHAHALPVPKAAKRLKVPENKPKSKKSKASTAANNTKQQHKLRPQQRKQLGQELCLLRKCFAIAQGVENEEYKIFPNKSIDDLILKLPSNNAELMQCWGIKEKRIIYYGSAILQVIRPYRLQNINRNHQQRQQDQRQQLPQAAPEQPPQQQIVTPTSLDEVRNLSVKELKNLASQFGMNMNGREKTGLQNEVWQAINNNPMTSKESEFPNVDDEASDSDEDVEITRELSVEEIVAQRVREAEARGEVFEIL
jgi:hypothetical protein